jgi:hypothetical protein
MQKLPMHLAAEKGKHMRLKSFLTQDLNVLNHQCRTPLYLAASNGHLRCVNMLLDAKADVNYAFDKAETALMIASENGHLDVVNTLIEARADVNQCTRKHKEPALDCACYDPSNHHIVAALLAAGARVNSHGSNLSTSLRTAILFNAI